MKMFFISLLMCCSLYTFAQAQEKRYTSQVQTENQRNQDIVKINCLWHKYLQSHPDSLYNNPYWNDKDKAKYKSYDLLRSEGYIGLYSMVNGDSELKNHVLSIIPLDKGDLYDIRSIWYWVYDESLIWVLASTHVLAQRQEDGEFRLANWLHWYSRDWEEKTIGKITYRYYPGYKFNISKAKKANRFLDFLEEKFDAIADHLEIYISRGWDDTNRMKGYEYTFGDTMVGDNHNLGGTMDVDNGIIYSNHIKGEYYEHEMMRIINSYYPHAHRLLLDGVAEYWNEDLTMRGVPIQEHFRRLDSFLTEHEEMDLRILDNFERGNLVEVNYLLGLAIVYLAMEKGGYDLLKEALRFGTSDDDMRRFLYEKLGIGENEIDQCLRSLVHHFAIEGFLPIT